jgi:hypothetical protein
MTRFVNVMVFDADAVPHCAVTDIACEVVVLIVVVAVFVKPTVAPDE